MAVVLLLLILPFLASAQDAKENPYLEGLLLLKQKDTQGALSALTRAARETPRDPMVWMALAEARMRAGDLAEATKASDTAAQLAPADPDVDRVRAMFHSRAAAQAPSPQLRAQHLRAAVKLDPARETYRIGYSQFLLDNRTEKEAEAELKAALQVFPRSPELHRLQALAVYAQGRMEDAIDLFLQAIDLAPAEETLYASLETLLPPPAGKLMAVRQRVDRYRAEHPERPLGHYLAALCHDPEAEHLLRRAIEADPDFWPAYFELHRFAEQRGEFGQVIELLKKVTTLRPDYAPAHFRLGEAYARSGDRAAARRERKIHHELTSETSRTTPSN